MICKLKIDTHSVSLHDERMGIAVVTTRNEDKNLCTEASKVLSLEGVSIGDAEELTAYLAKDPNSIILWDLDHPEATVPTHPISIQRVSTVLKKHAKLERVLGISDNELTTMPYLANVRIFDHHLFRRELAGSSYLIARLLESILIGIPAGIERFFQEGVKVQKLALESSAQRKTLVEAVNKTLEKTSLPSRLNILISQYTDELLMNAIFDAPRKDGVFYKKNSDRTSDFVLDPLETVALEFAVGQEYLSVCVRDQFGSMTKEAFMKSVWKNFVRDSYKPAQGTPAAGLGIYGILQSGLSLSYICEPGVCTEAYLFAPTVKNIKAMRKSFRFWSAVYSGKNDV